MKEYAYTHVSQIDDGEGNDGNDKVHHWTEQGWQVYDTHTCYAGEGEIVVTYMLRLELEDE